jgi:predicted GNAT family acetyltransferase
MSHTEGTESPITVRNNQDNHTYEAIIDGELLGIVVYEPAGESRLVLTHAAVEQHHRNHGIATELVTTMLDDIRRNHQTITVYCEVVVNFLRKHPEYSDLIDPAAPGRAELPKPQPAD